jgi:hypothetical protein
MPYKDPIKRLASQRVRTARYRATARGKAKCLEYTQSARGKEVRKGINARAKPLRKHYKKTKGRLAEALRSRLYQAIRWESKAGSAVSDLGCSIPELKQYLESKFQPGMTWDNYGQWHIDHINPLAKFDLTDREQFLQACHFTNLQPLWAVDNLAKRDKIR